MQLLGNSSFTHLHFGNREGKEFPWGLLGKGPAHTEWQKHASHPPLRTHALQRGCAPPLHQQLRPVLFTLLPLPLIPAVVPCEALACLLLLLFSGTCSSAPLLTCWPVSSCWITSMLVIVVVCFTQKAGTLMGCAVSNCGFFVCLFLSLHDLFLASVCICTTYTVWVPVLFPCLYLAAWISLSLNLQCIGFLVASLGFETLFAAVLSNEGCRLWVCI